MFNGQTSVCPTIGKSVNKTLHNPHFSVAGSHHSLDAQWSAKQVAKVFRQICSVLIDSFMIYQINFKLAMFL